MQARSWARNAALAVVGLCLMSGGAAAVADQGALATLNFLDTTGPFGSLVQGTDGNFYGSVANQGALGLIFQLTPQGALTALYGFVGPANGQFPSAVTEGRDGNFYGTTSSYGANNSGTIFSVTPAGVFTTLYAFAALPAACNDSALNQALVVGNDGNFYGTTTTGGANCLGTFYKFTPGGVQTTLYVFDGVNGANPTAPLVLASDGNFYGTTTAGGINGVGTVFKITAAGAVTTLASLAGPPSVYPGPSALVEGPDGNFYGTTPFGGAANSGTVFSVTPAGALTVLYEFSGSADGYKPNGLVLGSDGNFYGTTVGGCQFLPCPTPPNLVGTIFSITPAGALTTLYTFGDADGQNPVTGLVQGTDGNFYGTTYNGGINNLGTFFKFSTGLASMADSVVAPPANPSYSVAADGTVTLNWTAAPGATGYNVYATSASAFAQTGSMGNAPYATAFGTSITLTGINADNMAFKVAWVNAAGQVSGLSIRAVSASSASPGSSSMGGSGSGGGAMSPWALVLLFAVVLARARRTHTLIRASRRS
jgi:uncharacterized repeat protein (TIGR03803 family)